MEFFKLFDGRMETPLPYGWFHLLALVIIIGLTIFFCIKFKDCSDKTYRRIVFVAWIIILTLEILKQILINVDFGEATKIVYKWYIFPFQFCSSPLYIFPLVAFLKDGKVRDACINFTVTFCLLGGVLVCITGTGIYTSSIFLNLQTSIHHGSQVLVGILTFVVFRKSINIKSYFKGVIVFGIMSLIAIILNETLFYIMTENQAINMFYISSHYTTSLPILSSIYPLIPYWTFLVLYFALFITGGIIVYEIQHGIYLLSLKLKK